MSFVEKIEGRTSTFNSDGSVSLSVVYVIRMLVANATEQSVLAHPRLPPENSIWPEVPNAVVASRSPKQTENPFYWEVTVTYNTRQRARSPRNDKDKAPWEHPPRLSYSTRQVEEHQQVDAGEKPFKNAAGQQIVPSPVIIRNLLVLTVQRAFQDYNVLTASDFIDSTNSRDFTLGNTVFPKYTWLIESTSASDAWFDTVQYWDTSWVFVLKHDLNDKNFRWNPFRVLNQGIMQLKDGRLIPCEDDNKNRVSEPRNLDNFGEQQPKGAEPIFLDFRTKKLRNFNDLIIFD